MWAKKLLLVPIALAAICLSAYAQAAAGNVPDQAEPEWTPLVELRAQFLSQPRCPVYHRGEAVKVALKVTGAREFDDVLIWYVADYLGKTHDQGSFNVPKGDRPWSGELALKDYGAGYFELHLALQKSGVTLPAAGTRPGGFLAYGVEPDLEPLKLAHSDDSRFGAQGTNFVREGKFRPDGSFSGGDSFSPVYPLLGAKWCYRDLRLANLFAKGPDAYRAQTDPDAFKHSNRSEINAGLVLLLDLHSVPSWLIDAPAGVSVKNDPISLQRYPPRDFAAYKKLVAAVVQTEVVRRQVLFPNQARNYYQIHWEPDWHWKGTDEAFIDMYRAAHEAIHENDPDGLLLGPNYGVPHTGNRHLHRLFNQGLGPYLDGIVTHTYYNYRTREGKADFRADLQDLVAMTRQYLKPGARIMNTEWGVQWKLPPGEDPKALQNEAGAFLRGHITILGEGVDATWFFYTADHGKSGLGLFYNLTYPQRTFGAYHIAPKPVAMGTMTFSRLLEGSRSLGSIDYLGEQVCGYAFDRAGEKVACFWTTDERPASLRVPVGNVEHVTFFDPMGNATVLAPKDGIVTLAIGGIPSWLRGLGPEALPLRRANDNPPLWSGFAGNESPELPGVAGDVKLRLFVDGAWQPVGEGKSLRLPAKLAAGTFLLGAFVPATGNLQATYLVQVQPPLELRSTVASTRLTVSLGNPQAVPVAGTLALQADAKSVAQAPISLAASAQGESVFELRQFPRASQASLRFVSDSGASCGLYLPPFKPLFVAPRALTPPTIDGKLDDWQLELFQPGDYPRKPALSQQLNTRMAFQYDDRSLYLAFKINDPNHVQTQAPQNAAPEDSLQIGLAAIPDDSESGWASWQKFILMKDSRTGKQACWREAGNEFARGLVPPDKLAFVIDYDTGEVHYEIAIPWSQVSARRQGIPPEKLLGIGVMVNAVDFDRTGAKTPRAFADVTGGMAVSPPRGFALLDLR